MAFQYTSITHNIRPHVQVPVHMLPTPMQVGLPVKGRYDRHPFSPVCSRLSVYVSAGAGNQLQKLKIRVNSRSCLALAEEISATYMLNFAIQLTNTFSLQMWHHLRRNEQSLPQNKIYCQDASLQQIDN